MSGVLQSLVARAAGTERSGVQPRLRARFEAGGHDATDLGEQRAEVAPDRGRESTARAADRTSPMKHDPGAPETRADKDQGPVTAPPVALVPPEEPPVPSSVTPQGRAPETEKGPPVASVSGEPGPVAPERNTIAPDPLQPTLPPPHAERHEEARTPHEDAFAERTAEAPEPLLAPDAAALAETIPAAVVAAEDPGRDVQAPAPDPAEQPPAEISIHIGRIELRGEAARPAPRKTRRAGADLPGLSDYLNGGAS